MNNSEISPMYIQQLEMDNSLLRRELERLQRKNEYLSYNLKQVKQMITQEIGEVVIRHYCAKGQKLMAIKFIRTVWGLGLKEAKEEVMSLIR